MGGWGDELLRCIVDKARAGHCSTVLYAFGDMCCKEG